MWNHRRRRLLCVYCRHRQLCYVRSLIWGTDQKTKAQMILILVFIIVPERLSDNAFKKMLSPFLHIRPPFITHKHTHTHTHTTHTHTHTQHIHTHTHTHTEREKRQYLNWASVGCFHLQNTWACHMLRVLKISFILSWWWRFGKMGTLLSCTAENLHISM
jgi:hypothetical protein